MASSLPRLSRLFGKVQQLSPESQPLKPLLDKLFKERNLPKLVQEFKNLSESPRFRKNVGLYRDTVRRLALAKNFNSIQEILEHQKQYPDITSEGFAGRLIILYATSGMLENAHKLFDEMPELNCKRTVKSFNALLEAYFRANQFETAVKLFQELPLKLSIAPDVRSYNTVIKCMCELGSLDSAYLMLDEMVSKGVSPCLITFNTLMQGFYSTGRFSDGERVWARMEEHEFKPDIISFTSRIRGLIHDGKISEAVELLEGIRSIGMKPKVLTYNILIEWYCNNGHLVEAKRMYNSLLKDDCIPNRRTFGALIPFFYEIGDLDNALLLSEECLKSPCFLDVAILQRLAEGFVKESRLEEAEKLAKLAESAKSTRSELIMPGEHE